MSIRIYNDSLSGAAASQTHRAEELSRSGASGKPAHGTNSVAEDQVQISSVSESISAQSTHRAARIQHLAELYQTGKYQVNATDLSHALVNHALKSGGTETK